jgi:hypothetical protein
MLHFKLGLWSAADMFLAILSDNLPQSAEFSTGSKGAALRHKYGFLKNKNNCDSKNFSIFAPSNFLVLNPNK